MSDHGEHCVCSVCSRERYIGVTGPALDVVPMSFVPQSEFDALVREVVELRRRVRLGDWAPLDDESQSIIDKALSTYPVIQTGKPGGM